MVKLEIFMSDLSRLLRKKKEKEIENLGTAFCNTSSWMLYWILYPMIVIKCILFSTYISSICSLSSDDASPPTHLHSDASSISGLSAASVSTSGSCFSFNTAVNNNNSQVWPLVWYCTERIQFLFLWDMIIFCAVVYFKVMLNLLDWSHVVLFEVGSRVTWRFWKFRVKCTLTSMATLNWTD